MLPRKVCTFFKPLLKETRHISTIYHSYCFNSSNSLTFQFAYFCFTKQSEDHNHYISLQLKSYWSVREILTVEDVHVIHLCDDPRYQQRFKHSSNSVLFMWNTKVLIESQFTARPHKEEIWIRPKRQSLVSQRFLFTFCWNS